MSRPTDHEETIEHLRDIAGAIRDTITAKDDAPPLTPLPAIEYIPPRLLNAADRKLLHGLAVLLAERTAGVLRAMRVETITFDSLTATAAATTAATTALLACSTDDDAKGGAS